ncbi:hypothetical protein X757_07985 [Mesorhizobium sp. LSHC414A00]|nr:hypothetical protein X757_07985 [Mesorhizobium sp. LSHC414A00]
MAPELLSCLEEAGAATKKAAIAATAVVADLRSGTALYLPAHNHGRWTQPVGSNRQIAAWSASKFVVSPQRCL